MADPEHKPIPATPTTEAIVDGVLTTPPGWLQSLDDEEVDAGVQEMMKAGTGGAELHPDDC